MRTARVRVKDEDWCAIDLIIVCAANFALYSSVIQAGFTFDDRFAIEENPDVVGNAAGLLDLFKHDFWGQDIASPDSHKSFRPLTVAAYRMQAYVSRKIFQSQVGINPAIFHLCSIVFHSLVSVQVYFLGIALFGIIQKKVEHTVSPRAKALLAAVLFSVLPVHSEAVAGIVGQAETICCFLFLLSFQIYAKSMSQIEGFQSMLLLITSLSLALLSSFAKETGITVLGAMVAFDLLFTNSEVRIESSNKKGNTITPVRWKMIRIAGALCTFAIYVLIRKAVAGDHLVRIYRQLENPIPFHSLAFTRALTTIFIHGKYAQLLSFPFRMSADWSYACTDYVESLLDMRLLSAALLYTALFSAAVCMKPWKFRWREFVFGGPMHSRVVAFMMFGLFLAPFLPASNLFFYVGTAIGERLLYLPSIGYCLILSDLLACIHTYTTSTKRGGGQLIFAVLLFGTLAFYSIRTYTRNKAWMNNQTLFFSALSVCPNSAKVQLQNAILQLQRLDQEAAMAHLDEAQRILPTYCEADYWRGKALEDKGIFTSDDRLLIDSLDHFRKALDCKWVHAKSVEHLNKLYKNLSRVEKKNGRWFEEWSTVLLREDVNNKTQAHKYLDQAVNLYMASGQGEDAWRAATLSDGLDDSSTVGNPCSEMQEYLHSLASSGDHSDVKEHLYPYLRDGCGKQGPALRHKLVVHLFQGLNPSDPWLHNAWVEVLLKSNRSIESINHLQAAANLFLDREKELESLHTMQTMGEMERKSEALLCLDKACELSADPPCELLYYSLQLALQVPSANSHALSKAMAIRDKAECTEHHGEVAQFILEHSDD